MFAFFTAASTLDLPPAARAGRFSRPSGSGRSAARPAARGADDHPFQFASGSGGWLRRTPDPHSAHAGRSRIRPAVGARF